MGKEQLLIWRKRIMIVGVTLWSGIIASFLFAILAFASYQAIFEWLATATFGVTLVLMAIALLVGTIALLVAARRQKKAHEKEQHATI